MNDLALSSNALGLPMPVGSWLYNYADKRISQAIAQIVAKRKEPGYVENLDDEDGEFDDEDEDEDEDEGVEEDRTPHVFTRKEQIALEAWHETDMSSPPKFMRKKPALYKNYKRLLRMIDFECKIHNMCGGCEDCEPCPCC
jgi:hypothetical protein